MTGWNAQNDSLFLKKYRIHLIKTNLPIDFESSACPVHQEESCALSYKCKTSAKKNRWPLAIFFYSDKDYYTEPNNKIVYYDNQHLTNIFFRSISILITIQMRLELILESLPWLSFQFTGRLLKSRIEIPVKQKP